MMDLYEFIMKNYFCSMIIMVPHLIAIRRSIRRKEGKRRILTPKMRR